jgi:hypothetical protein
VLLVLLLAACGGGSDDPERTDDGRVVVAGRIPVGDLRVGDCFDNPAQATVANIQVVPCDQPHQIEVVGFVELPDGEYPGREHAEEVGMADCHDVLVEYVGGGATSPTSLALDTFVPTSGSWRDGDRTVQCLAFRPDLSPMSHSLQSTS